MPPGTFDGKLFAAKAEGWQTLATVAGKPLLGELGGRSAPLRFAPASDRIEYVAYRKGAGAWVALFNHGNIHVGCDRLKTPRATPPEPLCSTPTGPWRGTIDFRPDRLGLDPAAGPWTLYEVEGLDGAAFEAVIAGQKTFELKEVPAELRDGALRASVEVRTRSQFVVAPKGQGQEVFFGKP